MEMEASDDFAVVATVPAASLPYDKPAATYTLVRLPDDATQATCTFSCNLKFLVKDCDPNTGEPDDDGYEDEYLVSGARRRRLRGRVPGEWRPTTTATRTSTW